MASRPKTLAFVSDAVFPFHKGGKETRISYLTRALAESGYDVHIFTMKWWPEAGDYHADGVTYHALCKLYPLYTDDRRSLKQAVLFGFACLRLFKYDYDILEVDHMPGFPLFAAKMVNFFHRRPFFATWHEVWGRTYWHEYLGPVKGTIAYWLERWSVRMPDHIIAVSQLTEKRLRSVLHYKGPVTVIANGIDLSRIRAVAPATQTSDVLYVGRLAAHKNVDLLIRAIHLLKRVRPDIRCVIVGSGPEQHRLMDLIAKLKLENNVIMAGSVATPDEVYAYMKAANVFVLPSRREGFGVSVLEAFVCGLKVVTIDHEDNAARYLIPLGEGAVCQPTVTDVALVADRLLTRPDKALARPLIATYDWAYLAKQIERVYAA